jgi:putative tryptophan/tyrosine transport system substrate-binding protein
MRRRDLVIGSLVAGSIGQAWAQRPGRVDRIAIVHASSPVADISETGGNPLYRVFFEELRRLGHVEGTNLAIERYSGGGRTDHYAELVGEVVRRKPDVVFANTSPLVRQFKDATATIPIVGITADPVAYGIVASLARPGGNVTGVSVDAGLEVWGKRLETLREVLPSLARVGLLTFRVSWEGPQGQALRMAAKGPGISVLGPPLDDPVQAPEYRRVFSAMVQAQVDALVVGDAAQNYTNRQLIVDLAEANRLPALYPYRDFVDLGGLMAYAVDIRDLWRRAASYVDRILRGEKPIDIPIYQATTFHLIINVRSAKGLGLVVPPSLLARADEVIE